MKLFKLVFALALCAVGFNVNAGLFGFGDADGMGSKCLEKHSKAWCVWDAADVSKGVSDLDGRSFADSFSKKPDSGILDISMAVLDTQNFMRLKTDLFGMRGDVGMILLNALMHAQPLALNANRIHSWMPIDMAKTPEEAGTVMDNYIYEATKAAMDGHLTNEVKSSVSANKSLYTWDVIGGDCDKVKCSMTNIGKSNYFNGAKSVGVRGKAPAWMGGYDAWVFGKSTITIPYDFIKNNVQVTQTYLPQLSKLLPSWSFVSVCPETTMYGERYNVGMPFPAVFNQGVMSIPVFPEIKIEN